MIDRLDAFQRAHPWVGYPLAVVYKYVDDQGPYQAALITYYAFVSLFPLLLVMVTGLGFLVGDDPALRHRLVESAVGQFPVVGERLRDAAHPLRGSGPGLAFGIAVALYGGLGVGQALQNSVNRAWNVPRGDRPNPFHARGRSFVLLFILAAAVAVTAMSSTLTEYAVRLGGAGGEFERTIGMVGAAVIDTGLIYAAFRLLTARDVRWRVLVPGAAATAVVWQVLQRFGSGFVRHELHHADRLYGLFGTVFAIIAWIYLAAIVVLLVVEAMTVAVDRLWPRALMSPITDDAPLTSADRRAYELYVNAQRFKGHERVHAHFDQDDAPPDGPPPDE